MSVFQLPARPSYRQAVKQRKLKTHQSVQLAVFRGPAHRRGLVRRDFRLDGGPHVNAVVGAEVDVNLTRAAALFIAIFCLSHFDPAACWRCVMEHAT